MTMQSQELVTTDQAIPPALDYPVTMAVSLARAEIDHQITTARAYPRSVTRAIQNIVALSTLDEQSAEECIYHLPRGGKVLTGPSIRLAEIIANQWGNCRIAARVSHVDKHEKYIEAEAIFHDLETNMATTARARRRIFNKSGRLYDDDMILVTGQAACAIAKREAILGGVPKAVWRKAYDAVKSVIAGDIKTLSERRGRAIAAFGAFGVPPERVFDTLGVGGEDDVQLEHLTILTGMRSAIRNGEATVDEMFPPPAGNGNGQKKTLAEKMKDLSEDLPPHDPETGEIMEEPPQVTAALPEVVEHALSQEEALLQAAEEREFLEAEAREMALNGRRDFDAWYTGLAEGQQQMLAPHMKNLMSAANKAGKK